MVAGQIGPKQNLPHVIYIKLNRNTEREKTGNTEQYTFNRFFFQIKMKQRNGKSRTQSE
jgi:hypothetical protein